MHGDPLKSWKITGIIATLVIILSIPLYLLQNPVWNTRGPSSADVDTATFVGREKCISCHKAEYDKWENSHHDRAMDVATEETVLGDFNNAVFEHQGIETRFYRSEDAFLVHTQGADGKMADYEIRYTFGFYPLQQYLVPFPGGRLQCLPIAWDVERKQWYHLYPDEEIDPGDWLHWTRGGQNWNGMCAECHSTHLEKGYDPVSDTFQTTWSEIDVSCEACHGPASRHVAWAEMPDMARPPVANYALEVDTSDIDSRERVELCAPCHSRRAILGDYTHNEPDLLDSMLPNLLTSELYFADGQIKDEVYVYGSFTQSKMYHRDVSCNDCHDVHSTRILLEGNKLCLQCHKAAEYDTASHHFHKQKGEKGDPIRSGTGAVLFDVGTGAQCVQCHMPGRNYMGIDYRRDHSLRVPRPDISAALGTPNACNGCHVDKTFEWSNDKLTQWYGPGRRQHYATIIDAGRKRLPDARKNLIELAGDPLYPVIVRATALYILSAYPGPATLQAMQLALMDDEALVRRTAVERMQRLNPGSEAELIAPLLYDPVKAVRIEAARRLAGIPPEHLGADRQRLLETTLKEFESAMAYSADFAFGRYNLGNLYTALNRREDAIRNYEAAIHIDELFYPAKVNLAMHYSQTGKTKTAERLLRDVVNANPDLPEAAYSLGLLLVEMKAYEDAAHHLSIAARDMPNHSRVHYNLGLLLQQLKRADEAESAFLRAMAIAPDNPDYLYAAADHYLKRGRLSDARRVASRLVSKHPKNSLGYRLLSFIDQALKGSSK